MVSVPILEQPARGIVATLLVVIASFLFIGLFDFALFSGWVSYWLLCAIPSILLLAVVWRSNIPSIEARWSQPLKGSLLTLSLFPAALIVGVVYFMIVGGGIGPPTPMLMMCTIVSVTIMFWLAVMWGGWPFSILFKNPLIGGIVMLISCYVLNVVLFSLFYNFGFMKAAPFYVAKLDPGGLFNAWHALVFYVTALSGMFLFLNFSLWPFSTSPKLMAQPTLGALWTLVVLALTAIVYTAAIWWLKLDPVVFMAYGPVGLIFGTIVVMNMLQDSLFSRVTQPFRGVLNTATALAIGAVLTRVYVSLAPTLTGKLSSGAPAYELEVWIASALLSVTFPLLAIYADLFEMWPFGQRGSSTSSRDL
jgi:hypothetical protein